MPGSPPPGTRGCTNLATNTRDRNPLPTSSSRELSGFASLPGVKGQRGRWEAGSLRLWLMALLGSPEALGAFRICVVPGPRPRPGSPAEPQGHVSAPVPTTRTLYSQHVLTHFTSDPWILTLHFQNGLFLGTGHRGAGGGGALYKGSALSEIDVPHLQICYLFLVVSCRCYKSQLFTPHLSRFSPAS